MNLTSVPLVHITTVPISLPFLSGQPAFMRHHGFEVHVVSSPGQELGDFASREGAIPHAVPMSRHISPFQDLISVARLWRLLRKVRAQVVDAHTPKAGLLGMLAAWLAGVPVRIYHMHGLRFETSSGLKRRLLRWTEALSCRLAHQVLCVGPSIRNLAITEGICPPERIRVLRGGSINGVDAVGKFQPTNDGIREKSRANLGIPSTALAIGFVGRVVREKGIGELVEAWSELCLEFPDLHLVVVGPFEPQDPVSSELERTLRSDSRIHLLGLDWDTPRLYSAMDVVVLPSYREGFPSVPLEAGAMALPVVATLIPGCLDAVQDGVTGSLVPPQDAKSLTEAIRRYLREPALRRAHGEAGRSRVLREFRREALWAEMWNEYRTLMINHGLLREPGNASIGASSGSAL